MICTINLNVEWTTKLESYSEKTAMCAEFNAYIDESGDEGFQFHDEHGHGSSEWFILAAAITHQEKDREVSRAINRIKDQFRCFQSNPNQPLHWRKRTKHSQRKVITEEIAEEDFTISIICMEKTELDGLGKDNLYFYTARILLERISWFVDHRDATVDLHFENRGNMSTSSLESYLRRMVFRPDNEVRSGVIDKIESRQPSQLKNLQIADACAGAAWTALHKDSYGKTEGQYLLNLKDNLYKYYNDRIISYGIKFFPRDAEIIRAEDPEYEWLDQLK